MRTGSRTRGSDPLGRAILAGAVIAALAGGANRLLAAKRQAPPRAAVAPASVPVATSRPTVPVVRAASVESAAAPAAVPASLRGTVEDGALRVDEDGNLVLGPEVIRLFDYWLSTTGEERPEAIRARIVASIRARLGKGRAADQAVELLDAYLGYREASRGLRADGDVAARLEALRDLRRRSFGAAAAAKLFGDDERAIAVAIEQRRALTDTSLSASERDRRLAELESRLPQAVQDARAAATRPLREMVEEQSLRAAGASDDDVRAYRVATAGEDAADRLAALDQQRADWRRRLAAFREARAAILQSEHDPMRQQLAIKQLLDASFTPLEQIRVEAADQMESP